MSFYAIRENKILAKISEFTVEPHSGKTNTMTCGPSKDSDWPGPPSKSDQTPSLLVRHSARNPASMQLATDYQTQGEHHLKVVSLVG